MRGITGILGHNLRRLPRTRGQRLEEELIQSVLEWQNRSTYLIDFASIPFLVGPERATAERDDPFARTCATAPSRG